MNSNAPNSHSRQWWVQRWLELLDSYRFKKRLERARNYAREGNVLSIEFKNAQVLAQVQGSDASPYQVSLAIESFNEENWRDIITTLSSSALFLAQLLSGELPENIEAVFTANGLSLFPFTLQEIHSRCSCPDPANPCKHIGAVYYQLADRFSEDPFVIFQLRGRTKDQIINDLRQLRGQNLSQNLDSLETNPPLTNPTPSKDNLEKLDSSNLSKITPDLSSFWIYNESLESDLVVITPPVEGKNVLDILGTLPLPYSEAELVEKYLQQAYQTIPIQAMQAALGQNND